MWEVCFSFELLSLKNNSNKSTVYDLILQTCKNQKDLFIYEKNYLKRLFLNNLLCCTCQFLLPPPLVSGIRNSVSVSEIPGEAAFEMSSTFK